MQISRKAYGTPKTFLFLAVKLIILLLIFFALFRQFKSKGINPASLIDSFLQLSPVPGNVFFLVLVILLVVVNWGLEALKWQLLTRGIEHKSFYSSFKSVLLGLSAGIFTPLMIGDFWGRAQVFEQHNRNKTVGANLFNSVTQTFTAILLGAVAMLLFVFFFSEKRTPFILWMTVALSLAAVAGFLLITSAPVRKAFPDTGFVGRYLSSVSELSGDLVWKVLSLSLFRNLVFGIQFMLVYKLCGLEMSFLHLFIGVNLIFLVKTVAGGLNAFGDLSLREIVALYFFGMFTVPEATVVLATFLMWAINIFLPVLVGAFFIFNLKPHIRHA